MDIQAGKIKGIAIDLDGTVLGHGAVLSDRTRDVLRSCIAKGIRVIITTGRSPNSAESYRSAIGVEGPMVYYNGAMVFDMPSQKLLRHDFIGLEIVAACREIAHSENIHFQSFLVNSKNYFLETVMTDKPSEATKRYNERTGLGFTFGDMVQALSDGTFTDCVKGIFIADEQKLQQIRPKLQKKLGSKINIMFSADFIFEILAAGVSKGRGLESALGFCDLKPSEIVAFGDEENDLPLFAAAGHSVAPANARLSVREAAKELIGPNTEDSVAGYLEKLFLK
jgi:Cof subfamily protein (haloacid dehalogenase superfamily)